PFDRIKEQMAIQSEVADKLICFIYQGAMNRKTDLVDIGHSSTQRLYDEYCAYLRELGGSPA
ncbi:MAG: hypothetical protein GY851_32825, partial [bacterium]|nr:hypothetical protein [bacterium]